MLLQPEPPAPATLPRRHSAALLFQPRFDLQSGCALGGAASVRWLGAGSDTLQRACSEAAGWPCGRVSVGAAWRADPSSLLAAVGAALDGSGLHPSRLDLLVPQRQALHCPHAVPALAALRRMGIRLTLTGYRPNRAVARLFGTVPFTAVLLPLSATAKLPYDPGSATTVHAAVAAARQNGLHVLAAGIQTEEQRAVLAGLGCTEGQGPLFGGPVPAARLRAILDSSPGPCGPAAPAPASPHASPRRPTRLN